MGLIISGCGFFTFQLERSNNQKYFCTNGLTIKVNNTDEFNFDNYF